MKLLIAALAVCFCTSAQAWTVERLNETINSVNFIIGNWCSGTLISKEHRLILTNYHCIEPAIKTRDKEFVSEEGIVTKKRIEELVDLDVSQKLYDNFRLVGQSSYKAQVVAKWKESDLALLQVRAPLPNAIEAMVFAGQTVLRGETVYAVGNPMMLDASVTKGVVSSVNRMFRVSWADAEVPFIQIDAGITGGNSGGSLFNEQGELIGVPAAGADGKPIGLAIPFSNIQKFLTDNCWGEVWDRTAESREVCLEPPKEEGEE